MDKHVLKVNKIMDHLNHHKKIKADDSFILNLQELALNGTVQKMLFH